MQENLGRVKVHRKCGESRTRQEFRQEADLPALMRRYRRTGELPILASRPGWYGDFSNATDYISAMEKVEAARDAFNALDPKIRRAFGNNPARLLDALGDPAQHDLLRDLGVLEPLPSPRGAAALPDASGSVGAAAPSGESAPVAS